uniref:DASH complex subunit SPC19 n=1 Tax=Rhabditophanes sp. KR3021 TaxID=114890 RepID=A0AC35TRL0_9BILA
MEDTIEDNIYIDELNRLKLINSDVAESSMILKHESGEFLYKVETFISSASHLISVMKDLGRTVDLTRLRALDTRNALMNISNEKSNEEQQIKILIRERQMKVERLKDELESLRDNEKQQREFIQKLQSSV